MADETIVLNDCLCCVVYRGVRVYPYPLVYPTRPAGMGRVRVDVLRVGSGTGTKSTGTGIPVFTRKEHHFHDVRAISNAFFISSFENILGLLTIKVETIAV